MISRRRLYAVAGVVAALLVAGRMGSAVSVRAEWFARLGASSVWYEELRDTITLYGLVAIVALLFAGANVSAVRRTVVSLVLPARVANVEIAEEVPSIRLRWVAALFMLGIAVVTLLFVPAWSGLALWRAHPVFAESDPYFALDLSHFVAWLPFERQLYTCALVLFASTVAVVVGLYSLTPSLRFAHGRVRASIWVQRHLGILGFVMMLLAAWGFRLAALHTLVSGSGPGGIFTRTDHVVMIRAYFVLELASIAAGVFVAIAAWMAQTTAALATISIIAIVGAAVAAGGPAFARHQFADPAAAASEMPYLETRAAYTSRAYPRGEIPTAHRFRADTSLIMRAGHEQLRGGFTDYFYPNAAENIIVDDGIARPSPVVGTGLARFIHAWAQQSSPMLSGDTRATASILIDRDVRERIREVVPVLSQSGELGAIPTSRGILWIVDLYSTSDWYPLSAPKMLEQTRLTYAHHAAVAYVSGGTGAVAVVPDAVLDPLARAWFGAHPGRYVNGALPDDWLTPPGVADAPATTPATDSLFKAGVRRVYDRMRAALDSGNLRSFGVAFDSLGTLVQRHR